MINEQLLQFIWQFQYFNQSSLATVDGEPLQIINCGNHNTNQGPDFLNAKVQIGSTIWAGSIELHVKASDWQRHKHDNDKNYKNVILHVVYENDLPPVNMYVLELKERITVSLLKRYAELMQNRQFIACAGMIQTVSHITLSNWKERLVAERLMRKAAAIEKHVTETNKHWEEVFWWLLAGNFGMKVNAIAFEAVAQSIPLNILAKHKNNLVQLEALLLGQAGLLDGAFAEKYPLLLQREYKFLQTKYKLKTVHPPVQFLRMRPGNFPTLRLAQLAALVQHSAHLFSKIIEESSVQLVMEWFSVTANDFWHYHYKLDDASVFRKKTLGKTTIENIVINTIVPVLFAYGAYSDNQSIKDKALRWLDEVAAEKNYITKGFQALGLHNKSAWDSQAFIELKTRYCNVLRCLQCAVGNSLLKSV